MWWSVGGKTLIGYPYIVIHSGVKFCDFGDGFGADITTTSSFSKERQKLLPSLVNNQRLETTVIGAKVRIIEILKFTADVYNTAVW